jgi:hypothetical protein
LSLKKFSLDTRHLAVTATILPLAFAGPLGRLALDLGGILWFLSRQYGPAR